jgi:hypothetical protein
VTLVDLISQLEEPKFLRLFRHLVDQPDPQGEERLNLAAVPIGLRNAELWLKPAGRISSVRSFAESWVFQIAHLPVGVWTEPVISEFAESRLTKAFDALKDVDEPLNLLLGDHLECAREGLFTPGRCTYHFFTNAIVGLDEASVTRITDIARRLFEERFGASAGRNISFGLGNPETVLGNPFRAYTETFGSRSAQYAQQLLFARPSGRNHRRSGYRAWRVLCSCSRVSVAGSDSDEHATQRPPGLEHGAVRPPDAHKCPTSQRGGPFKSSSRSIHSSSSRSTNGIVT